MNWKVRLKNPVFLLTFISTLIAVAYRLAEIAGIIPRISENLLIDFITVVISALTTIGVLVDPTTKGVADSERAMSYTEPATGEEEEAEG